MAQGNLANLYLQGSGVERDYKLAAFWAYKCAMQGHPRCEYLLGWMYAHGAGVAQDSAKAHQWLEAAIASGDADYVWRAQKEMASEAAVPSAVPAVVAPGSVTARYEHGGYVVDGTVDGASTLFTVDTGATIDGRGYHDA
jgi:hypothetical protein